MVRRGVVLASADVIKPTPEIPKSGSRGLKLEV